MAIVAEYHFGNTVCLIDDSYIVKTQEEHNQILNNVVKIWTDSERRKIQNEIIDDDK